jgi:hypothetical protein
VRLERRADRGDAVADRYRGHAVLAPALLARELAGRPIAERAGVGDADLLPLQLVDRLDRRIPRHADGEERRRSRGLAHRDHRCAFGDEGHLGARAVADIDAAGGDGLRHLAAAAELDDLHVEPVLFEDPELVAHIHRDDRIRGRRRLADGERGLRGGRHSHSGKQ